MAYFFMDPLMTRYHELQGKPPLLQTLFQFQFLLFEPGERWMYSPGIDWAGKAVSPWNLRVIRRRNGMIMSDMKRLSESLL